MKVTPLNGLFKTHRGDFELYDIFKSIREGEESSLTFKCRSALLVSKQSYQNVKVQLPCFTPSGRFRQGWKVDKKTKEKRPAPPRKDHLISYNGNVVLDYDNLEVLDLFKLAEDVRACPHTLGSFDSPSGNGHKIIVRTTNTDPEQHYDVFQAVSAYYEGLVGIKAKGDKSSCNVNRLCFVSTDPNIYENRNATPFEFQPKLFPKTNSKDEIDDEPYVRSEDISADEYIVRALNRVEKKGLVYVEGQRREFIKKFTVECVKYGVTQDECKTFVDSSLLTSDCDSKMVFTLIEYLYETIKPSEHGMYIKWSRDQKKESTKEPQEDYTPELYQAKEEEDSVIALPEVKDIEDLRTEVKKAILHQRSIEQALNQFFDFRINILKNREEYKKKEWKKYREVDKIAYNSIVRSLRLWGVNTSPAKLEQIILSHFSKQVHPLKEMFERWYEDYKEDPHDYIKDVAQLVKTDAPNDLFYTVFKKWLVASVANVFVEGQCTNHHCIILCGDQGTNKTTFFTSLFSSEYIFTGHMDLRNKDSVILLTDTFLVVLDEQFSVIDKESDWETLKSMITMPRVKSRWHYAKNSRLAPRVANFCGTANRIEILQDDTGNRRFVPFQLTAPIDINRLRKLDIRRMWAQAYKLYKENWFYLPTRKEKNDISRYQQDFKKLSDEHYFIVEKYEPYSDKNGVIEYLSSAEIQQVLDKVYSCKVSVAKVGRAMKFLNFEQKTIIRPSDSRRGRYWLVRELQ